MGDFDLFLAFTQALLVGVTIYYTLWSIAMLRAVQCVLEGDSPRQRLLRLYLTYHLLTIRLAPLRGELLQIAIWTLALIVIWVAYFWM